MVNFKRILFVLFVVNFLQLSAQEPPRLFLSIDFGTRGLDSELNDSWPIRQDVGYSSSNANRTVNLDSEMSFLGVSAEYALNNRWSLISGLRFITLESSAIKNDYDRGGSFYLRLKSDGPTVEYTRIKSIKEQSAFLGIPLEVKFSPFNFKYISLYAKLSGEFAYSIYNSTDIEFKLLEMERFEKSVLNDLNLKYNPFYTSVYATFGARVKLGKSMYTSIDVFTPSFTMSQNNSRLLNVTDVAGTQISLIFPLNK
ncbi:hypothetical protein MASR2M117_17220 [Paludibacter sp.]